MPVQGVGVVRVVHGRARSRGAGTVRNKLCASVLGGTVLCALVGYCLDRRAQPRTLQVRTVHLHACGATAPLAPPAVPATAHPRCSAHTSKLRSQLRIASASVR